MTTVRQVYEAMQAIAPLELAEHWDNPGLLVDCGGQMHRVLAALDITPEVVAEAAARSFLIHSKRSARRMCLSSWCRRAFLPSVCTPIWMLPRAA